VADRAGLVAFFVDEVAFEVEVIVVKTGWKPESPLWASERGKLPSIHRRGSAAKRRKVVC
jgi:hypothetical protein